VQAGLAEPRLRETRAPPATASAGRCVVAGPTRMWSGRGSARWRPRLERPIRWKMAFGNYAARSQRTRPPIHHPKTAFRTEGHGLALASSCR